MFSFFGALPIDQSTIKHTKNLKQIPSKHVLGNLPEKKQAIYRDSVNNGRYGKLGKALTMGPSFQRHILVISIWRTIFFLSGFVAFAFWWEDLHHVFFFEIAHNFVKRRGDKWLAFRKPLGGVGPAKWAREDIFHQNRPTNQPVSSSNIGFCGQKLSLAIPAFIMDTFDHFDEQF